MVEQNYLCNLLELFLVEVVRKGKLISLVGLDVIIQGGDKLIFLGNVKNFDMLLYIKGLIIFVEVDGLLWENLIEVIVLNCV